MRATSSNTPRYFMLAGLSVNTVVNAANGQTYRLRAMSTDRRLVASIATSLLNPAFTGNRKIAQEIELIAISDAFDEFA